MTQLTSLAVLLAPLVLAACGGTVTHSQFGPSLPTTTEGLWSGVFSISGDVVADTRTFNALVTPDGELWMTYSRVSDTPLAGVIQGAGTADAAAGTYSAANLTERNATQALAAALSGIYVPQSKFSGNLTTNAGSLRTLTFNPTYAVNYDLTYSQSPGLPATATHVNGTGISAGGETAVALVLDLQAANPDQVLVGQSGPVGNACYFTSPVTGATAGNYFTVTLSFLASTPCSTQGLAGPLAGVLFRTPAGKYVLVTEGAAFGFQET